VTVFSRTGVRRVPTGARASSWSHRPDRALPGKRRCGPRYERTEGRQADTTPKAASCLLRSCSRGLFPWQACQHPRSLTDACSPRSSPPPAVACTSSPATSLHLPRQAVFYGRGRVRHGNRGAGLAHPAAPGYSNCFLSAVWLARSSRYRSADRLGAARHCLASPSPLLSSPADGSTSVQTGGSSVSARRS